MESFATPYPVIFHDGEHEHDKGHVGVHSVLTFKRFQSLMAQKTGIPANQLAAVFVCRRTLKDTEKRQKLPINENTNFNIILNQHNPSRERDCHFLVSLKKSKKERKGTRKRNSEAENADDEDSSSSRGDLSPSDERPKAGTTDDTFSPEVTSPRNFIQRPSSPSIIPSPSGNSQRSSEGSPSGKLTLGVADYKVGRTLLRREGAGPNGVSSPRSVWGHGAMSQREEGIFVSCGAAGKVESHTLQLSNGTALQQEDRREADNHWMQSSPVQDDGRTLRQTEKVNGHTAGQPQLHQTTSLNSSYQDRFNDSISQGSAGRSPSAVIARGHGIPVGSSSVLQRSSSMSSSSNSSRPAMSSISSTAAGAFVSRVSMGSLAAVASTSGGLTLQQAHAHLSHMQQHHSPLAGSISQLELSKLMLSGLVARDIRGETTKTCKFCCFLRERNIGPPPFHWCVEDTITKGFRGPSPAGPIGRPVKRHVEAAA